MERPHYALMTENVDETESQQENKQQRLWSGGGGRLATGDAAASCSDPAWSHRAWTRRASHELLAA